MWGETNTAPNYYVALFEKVILLSKYAVLYTIYTFYTNVRSFLTYVCLGCNSQTAFSIVVSIVQAVQIQIL